MFMGIHAIIYSGNADADRAFFRDVLGFAPVDAGGGWLIFATPPAELAFHPIEGGGDGGSGDASRYELWFMCADVREAVAWLGERGVRGIAPVTDRGWGLVTGFSTPAGTRLSLYQPKHPTAIGATRAPRRGVRATGASSKRVTRARSKRRKK